MGSPGGFGRPASGSAGASLTPAQLIALLSDPAVRAAVDALIDERVLETVGGVADPNPGPLAVAGGAATVDVTGAYRYLTAEDVLDSGTVTGTFAITLTSTKASWTGAYIRIEITNSGGGVTEPTFAAGPTVYYEGSTTFDTADGATNIMRIECVDDTAPGTYTYTWLPQT